jgi:DNA-directed RNA polymerase specialized sigma24 family protein
MLARLPERQRQIVELRLLGLNGVEIAEVVGLSHSAVKSAQFRAYGALRDLLREERADLDHTSTSPETDDAQS